MEVNYTGPAYTLVGESCLECSDANMNLGELVWFIIYIYGDVHISNAGFAEFVWV
jgi:hypothetical protein